MEGDRLLQCIKSSTDYEPLLKDLEVYLAPVLHHKTGPSQAQAAKYGLYSMKVLRTCVQQLTVLKTGHATLTGIIRIANKSYECIRKILKFTKMVPLSLEKLLFHMVMQSMAKGLVADATVFARHLHYHLNLCRHNFVTGDGIDNEYDTVCKQAFNQLWKACVDLEHSSKLAAAKHMVVLGIRLQALAFLMLTCYEVSWVVERALRAVAEFDRACNNSLDENNQVLEFLQNILTTLLNNVGDTQKKQDLLPEEASELLSHLFELTLQFAKRCSHLKRPEEALTLHEKLQEIILKCGRHSQKLYLPTVNAIESALHMRRLSSSDPPKNAKRSKSKLGDLVETVKEKIQSVESSTSKTLEKGDPDFLAIHCLVEALEFFKKEVEGAANQKDRTGSPSPALISEELVPTVDVALKLLADLLQAQREHLQATCGTTKESFASKGKQQRVSLQKAVNRQLAVLNLMSGLLLNRMDRTVAEANSDSIQKMIEDALSVCQKTKSVIEEVSSGAGGAVSTNEHRWLGTNAYNLGLMCYKKKWYSDAVPLLSMACQQLEIWCLTKELVDEEKVNKVQLLSKYELLLDCQRRAGQHRDAMQTAVTFLWTHIDHLTDQLTVPVECWVKAKRDAVKASEDEQLRARTLFDAIQEIEGAISDESCSLVARLLEQELSICKAQRYDTTVEQYAIVCDLLSLYSDDKMRLHRAHAHIEQAQLLRDGTLDTDCSPVDCCKEAIHLLEELGQDFLQQQQQEQEQSSRDYLVVFDLLATAHFWLYICQSEANQATYITSQFASAKEDPLQTETLDAPTTKKDKASSNAPSTSYTLADEYAATEPLDRALDIWSDLMTANDNLNKSMFNDPVSTGYCLRVAASLCELADRPIQQVQALNLLVLLSTATSSNEDAILAYCQIIRALCRLGAVQEAESLLGQAQTLMGKVGPEADEGAGLDATFRITKCYVMLAARKIREFETLLEKALQIHGHKRRSRQAYLRNASIKHLQALYLLRLTPEQSQDAPVRCDLIPDDLSPLELWADGMRLQMGVGRLVLGEGVFSSEQSTQGDGFKLAAVGSDSGWNDIEFNQWTVLASVLRSLYDVGSLCMEQGCSREAKSFLKEGLVIADKFMLPRRSVAFLLQLSNLHAQCGREEDCLASLSTVQQVFHLPEKASQPRWRDKALVDAQGDKKKCGSDTSEEPDEDDIDDDFIRTKRISISMECSARRPLLVGADTASSPSLRTLAAKLPGYHYHPPDCLCASCSDVSLHAQEISSFLRRAQWLELQGEVTQALTNLQAGLDMAAWSSRKTQSLLCKSCSCLQNVGSGKQTEVKEAKRSKAKQSSPDQFSLCAETASEIHACIARLTLLNGSLSEAEQTIKRGLEQSTDESIPKAWLQFYEILAALELQAQGSNTTVSDLIFSTWDVQSSCKHQQDEQAPDDLASKFEQLDLGKPVGKRQTHFQDSVFSERMQRPEVSRKLSEKVSELGIFCDISDDDEGSDAIPNTAMHSAKSSTKRQQVAKATPHNVGLSSKKGALMFSVRKKRPAKKAVKDDVTPLHSAALTAFDFDEPSPAETKKKGTRGRPGRSTKATAKRNAKIITLFDSDVDEVFEEEIETQNSRTGTGSKRQTAKKSVPIKLDLEDSPSPSETGDLQEAAVTSKPSRKCKQQTGVSKDSVAKPRRGRKPNPTDTEPSELSKPTTTRSRRGRKPNTENLRSEVVTQVRDDILQDLLSTTLDLESPVKLGSPVFQSPNLGDACFDFETNNSSRNLLTPNSLPNGTSPLLQDLDEIEIPRAGCDSDSEESRTTLKTRRKTARKTATSKRRTAKRCTVEDTEVLRGAKNADAESTRVKNLHPAALTTTQDGTTQSGSLKTDTGLGLVIANLEKMRTQVCRHAPALLYRRVCQLLATCCGDRDPVRAAFYLSEAAAVTLRHQKLASLTKKMKKLKKGIDVDGIQNLSASLAAMALDRNSKNDQAQISQLQYLVDQKALFTFRQDTQADMQQTISALPEGWAVCILSVVSSSASLAGSLTAGDRLIVCRFSRGTTPVIVNRAMCPTGPGMSAASLLEEFDNILTESKLSVKETDKKAWWTSRQELDQRMQALTEAMEETFLGQWKGLLIGQRKNKEERRAVALAAEKLKTLVESASQKTVDSQLCQCILESVPKLSKPQLNSALTCLTGLSPGTEQFSSLVSSIKQLTKDMAPATGREPVILILDKQIQQLPWETTPILRDTPICRMPSLYFILSHLKSSSSSNPTSDPTLPLDPSDAFYVLNPSNDLANTQKAFHKWFEKDNGWQGVVARPPTKEEYRSALTDHQLFVFCGHGNGREFLTGDDIQRLTCRATSLLIGCSSGRLLVTGNQEATGMVLNYLVAECPCLVANLWDVTDRDIDRFLEQLLRVWLDRGGSLLDGMAQARQACKLQHLIGCSPVVYGLPVRLQENRR